MAYLGRQPIIGNYQVLDAITASATATYALTKGGVAVFPQTPANCIVSLNGVIQAPFSSYNISGSNIVFASALTGSDSIDFITVLGDVLNIGTPTDGTVTTAKIADANVTSAKMFSGFANGITEADQWRLTADITADVDPIASNLERVDNTGFGYIGTGMSVASGTWTFPSTGIYLIRVVGEYTTQSGDNVQIQIKVTTNNSSYTQVAMANGGEATGLACSATCEFLFDVTSTANCKARFQVTSLNAGSIIEGDTNKNRTSFTFIRLGDT